MYAALVKYTLVLLCLLVCTRGVIYFILGWMVVVLQTVRCLVKVWQLHCRYTYILHIYSCKIYLLSGIVHVRWDGLVCHACISQLDKIHPMFMSPLPTSPGWRMLFISWWFYALFCQETIVWWYKGIPTNQFHYQFH